MSLRGVTEDTGRVLLQNSMNLNDNPFPIVFSQGDASTQLACLDFFGLGESSRAQRCLQKLVGQQRVDGTFPSGLDPSQWGMQETIRNTLLLLEVGVSPREMNVRMTVQFILDHQRPDGGWCENPELRIPREQVWLSNHRSITWLTVNAVELLRQVGMQDRPECQLAVGWLKSMQNQEGGWPSLAGECQDLRPFSTDPDSTVQVTFLLGELFGESDPAYRVGKALFENRLDECARDVERGYWVRDLDGETGAVEVYHLTHLFLSWLLDPPRRFRHGYVVHDPRVERIMETLMKLQNADGGWTPFWAGSSSPVYTVIALKVLILSGMVSRDSLLSNICCHAG